MGVAFRRPVAQLDRHHPQLEGCRFFWHSQGPGGLVAPRNLMGKGLATVQAEGTVARTNKRNASLTWSGGRWTWPTMDSFAPRETNEITVIVSGVSDGASFATRMLYQAYNSGSGMGFQFFHLDGAFSNRGLNFVVFNSTTPYFTWIDIGTATYNKRCAYAVTYKKGQTKALMYENGRPRPTSSSGDPSSFTIPLHGAASLHMGGPSDGSTNWTGEMAWMMVFDRAISPARIAALSREESWEFLDDDPPLRVPSSVSVSYANSAVVGQAYTPSGPVLYQSAADALAYVDGDLTFGPQPAAVATYRNRLEARHVYAGSYPEFARYTNRLRANQALSASAPVQYSSVSRVGQRLRGRTDGRVDLLGNLRYRR